VSPLQRLTLSLGVFVLLIAVATTGFVVLTGVGAFDALYFAVITVTQVGYGETIELGRAGRTFAMIVVLLGVATIWFAVISGIEFLVEGHLQSLLGRRRMDRRLKRVQDHTIVCGFGQVGRHVAAQLQAEGRDVVVVDPDPARVEMAVAWGLPVITGDASKEEVLREAGLERARSLVACAHDDADNVLISLTARGVGPDLFIVARVKNDENEQKATRAGADRVIAPAAIGGRRIATLVTRPAVVDFLDVVTHGSEVDLILEEVVVRHEGLMEGRSLRELSLPERFGITIVALQPAGDTRPQTRPDPDRPLCAGDVVVAIGGRAEIDQLRRANT
jgi:voltage-gated potassium channel